MAGGKQAETLRQEMKSKGLGEIKKWGAEPWKCSNRSWKGINSLMMIMICDGNWDKLTKKLTIITVHVKFSNSDSVGMFIADFVIVALFVRQHTLTSRPWLSLPSLFLFPDSHSRLLEGAGNQR